ncbi:MAG: hypothetical protein V9E83_12310 [Baekduia sp.]
MSAGIGTLREGPLHAALKAALALPGDRLEVPFGRFVIDLVRADGELVEIQTGGFGPLGRKFDALLDEHRMRVVMPVPAVRRIVRVDEHGELLSARRSARRGTPVDLFDRLVSWPTLVAHPNLTVEVLLCEEDHVRGPEAGRSRSGRRTRDPGERILRDIVERVVIERPAGLLALLPASTLAAPITTRSIASDLGVPRVLATRVVYCLRELELIERDGADGRLPVYRLP